MTQIPNFSTLSFETPDIAAPKATGDNWRTPEGISVKNVYGAADLAGLDFLDTFPGAAPFLRGQMVDEPETIATAIRIGHPQSWDQAWTASRESGGWFDELTDAEILATQKLLSEKEGIFCEPASATSVAGVLRDLQSGKLPEGKTIVCTLTGNGLKDPDTAIGQFEVKPSKVPATLEAVKRAILEAI